MSSLILLEIGAGSQLGYLGSPLHGLLSSFGETGLLQDMVVSGFQEREK